MLFGDQKRWGRGFEVSKVVSEKLLLKKKKEDKERGGEEDVLGGSSLKGFDSPAPQQQLGVGLGPRWHLCMCVERQAGRQAASKHFERDLIKV